MGEVEFVAGVAAMSDSGRYGPTRICAGIVGYADLTLADRVEPVLAALAQAGGGRFRGVRNSAGFHPGPGHQQQSSRRDCRPLSAAGFRVGSWPGWRGWAFRLDAWVFHPQLADAGRLGRACPTANIVMCNRRRRSATLLRRPKGWRCSRRGRRGMTELAACPNVSVKLGGVMMRLAAFDYSRRRIAAHVGGARRPLAPIRQDLHRVVRR